MADALWMRIREVQWDQYSTSDNSSVPNLLKNLASRKQARSMKASHQIWTSLCGGGTLHSAAIPCVPFLIEILAISDPAVKDGIIDILNRMVAEGGEHKAAVAAVKEALTPGLRSKDEIVKAKVKDLLASLDS